MEKLNKMQETTTQYPHLDESEIRDALDSLGFQLRDRGLYWQTSAIWRNGDNPTAIQIYKDSGVWRDFVDGNKHQPFSSLVGKVLGTNDKKQISKYVKVSASANDFIEEKDNRVKIEMEHIYSLSELDRLLPHHKFYLDKKISQQTLDMYKGGYATAGKMYGRYIFPIFQENMPNNIVGFTGRALRYQEGSGTAKWKHIGQRKNWLYPLYLPFREEYPFLEDSKQKKEIIIVESIGDSLALTENKMLNHIVTFGLGLSSKQICKLVELNPDYITICCNNDKDKQQNAGLDAAIKIFVKLMDFFDLSKVQIKLPVTNDLSDAHVNDEFNSWAKKSPDKTTQLKFILKTIESTDGIRIIPNKQRRSKTVKFLQDYLED
jgi:hypothetical protein|tara:strand:+ start:4 stop:1131 length:1128 start_codon:yes stop_codon:yes gene_type:complete